MSYRTYVLRIQRAYPQIYLACHRRHQNARTTADHLSPRDASVLAHLDFDQGVSPGDLARHLGVAKSTLSAAIDHLETSGFVSRRKAEDGRRHELRLTTKGVRAMSESSVLEPDRVRNLLKKMTRAEIELAIAGLEVLAAATKGRAGATSRSQRQQPGKRQSVKHRATVTKTATKRGTAAVRGHH